MTSSAQNESDLVHDYFRAKAQAYASPLAVSVGLRAGSEDFVLVDGRNPAPGLTSRIAGSVLIPEREIARRLDALPKDRLIILYCWDTWCGLATSLALLLIDHGYLVKELHGGSHAWKTLRLPEIDVRGSDVAAAA